MSPSRTRKVEHDTMYFSRTSLLLYSTQLNFITHRGAYTRPTHQDYVGMRRPSS